MKLLKITDMNIVSTKLFVPFTDRQFTETF